MTVEEANTKAIPHMSNTIQITVVCPDAVRGPLKGSSPTAQPTAPTADPEPEAYTRVSQDFIFSNMVAADFNSNALLMKAYELVPNRESN